MKTRISILALSLVSALILTACTGGTDSPDPISSGTTNTQNSAAPVSSVKAHIPVVPSAAGGTLTYKGFTASKIPGDIKNVYYGGGANVLVTTPDALYLYDLSQDAIAAKTKTAPNGRSYRFERYQPTQNGFVGLLLDLNRPNGGNGLQGGDGIPNATCVFYNLQLEKVGEVNVLAALSNVMSEDDRGFGIQELRAIDVSGDGSKIAVGGFSALYVHDVKTGDSRQIVPESRCILPSDVRFAGNSRIAFGGAYLPAGAAESVYSYGTVNTDGSGLQIHTPKGFLAGELPGSNESLLLIGQDMRAVSGKLLLHPAGGTARTVKLATAQEGDTAYLSDGGTHFATAAGGEKLTIRIYELDTGRLLSETPIAAKDSILISRVPDVRILDDLRTAVVIYGQHVDTQIKVIQF